MKIKSKLVSKFSDKKIGAGQKDGQVVANEEGDSVKLNLKRIPTKTINEMRCQAYTYAI